MKIRVLIEALAGNRYRACSGEPFAVVAEGPTPHEAVDELQRTVERRIAAGAQVVALDVPVEPHPWVPFRGMFRPDDPCVQEWQAELERSRSRVEGAA